MDGSKTVLTQKAMRFFLALHILLPLSDQQAYSRNGLSLPNKSASVLVFIDPVKFGSISHFIHMYANTGHKTKWKLYRVSKNTDSEQLLVTV